MLISLFPTVCGRRARREKSLWNSPSRTQRRHQFSSRFCCRTSDKKLYCSVSVCPTFTASSFQQGPSYQRFVLHSTVQAQTPSKLIWGQLIAVTDKVRYTYNRDHVNCPYQSTSSKQMPQTANKLLGGSNWKK